MYPEGITDLKRLTIDPQVKSVHRGYTDQTIGIMSSSIHTKVTSSKAQFKEFEPRFKFKSRLKYGCFHLSLYSFFQDLGQRSIKTGFSRI